MTYKSNPIAKPMYIFRKLSLRGKFTLEKEESKSSDLIVLVTIYQVQEEPNRITLPMKK